MVSRNADIEEARRLVERFEISYVLLPGGVRVAQRTAEITIRFEIRGCHRENAHRNLRCPECKHLLRALFEVGDVVQRVCCEGTPAKQAHVSYVPTPGDGGHTSLLVESRWRMAFAEAADGWALQLLERVADALRVLGCKECDNSDSEPPPPWAVAERPAAVSLC